VQVIIEIIEGFVLQRKAKGSSELRIDLLSYVRIRVFGDYVL
jgi:hypothetical protein